MIRNKLLMLAVIVLLSFAWLAIEVATWLMSLMARGAATDPSYTIVLTLCRWLRLEMPL